MQPHATCPTALMLELSNDAKLSLAALCAHLLMRAHRLIDAPKRAHHQLPDKQYQVGQRYIMYVGLQSEGMLVGKQRSQGFAWPTRRGAWVT